MAIFENPAGLGYFPVFENMVVMHRDSIVNGMCLKGIGLGILKHDPSLIAEAGLGYKLPGAFSLGYAYQFSIKGNRNNVHYLGIACRPNNELALGFKMTVARTKIIQGGASIMPVGDYLILSADFEYEGIAQRLGFYCGGMFRLGEYFNLNFHSDNKFNWAAGLGIGYSNFRVAAAYTRDRKFGIGLIVTEERTQ
jgi:hypothetical protein